MGQGLSRAQFEKALEDMKASCLKMYDDEGLRRVSMHMEREPEEIGPGHPEYDPASQFVQRVAGPELLVEIRMVRGR